MHAWIQHAVAIVEQRVHQIRGALTLPSGKRDIVLQQQANHLPVQVPSLTLEGKEPVPPALIVALRDETPQLDNERLKLARNVSEYLRKVRVNPFTIFVVILHQIELVLELAVDKGPRQLETAAIMDSLQLP